MPKEVCVVWWCECDSFAMNTMLVYTCKHYARVECRYSPSHTPHFAQSGFVLYFVVAAVVAIVSIFCVSRTWLLSFFAKIRWQYQHCSSSRSGYISNCTKMLNAKMCVRVCWSVMIVCIQSFTIDRNHHTEFRWDRKSEVRKINKPARGIQTPKLKVLHTHMCRISFYKIIWDLSWMRQFFSHLVLAFFDRFDFIVVFIVRSQYVCGSICLRYNISAPHKHTTYAACTDS